jgi:hypothetical protein
VLSDGDLAKDLYHLTGEYVRAVPIVRGIVDRVLVATCGYSLATIIRVAAGEDRFEASAKSPDYTYPLDDPLNG